MMKETETGICIEEFDNKMMLDTSDILSWAFVTNPLHVKVFGSNELEKNRQFFATALSVMKGTKLVATEDSRVLGFIHWVVSPNCQFSTKEKLMMTPKMIKAFGISSAMKVGKWLSVWAKHDPAEKHVHLGPIGIEPGEQGRGIGGMLMNRFCEELEKTGLPGYLETDRPENVNFYQLFGFETINEVTIFGVKNYFMWRK